MNILQADNISLSFGAKKILKDISFSLTKGEFLSLIGPSGCGKTTLLRVLAGLEQADAGSLSFRGTKLADTRQDIFVIPQQREFGFVFQNYDLWPHMTVAENIAFPLKMAKWDKHKIVTKVNSLITDLRLQGLAERRPEQLSGGQKQRVGIARALAKNPEVILFDEPLSSLDADLRQELSREIKDVAKRHALTCIYVTHDRRESFALSDRVILLKDGKIHQSGTPAELYNQPIDTWTAKFLDSGNIVRSATLFGLDEQPSGSYMIPRVAIRPARNKKGVKAVVASCVFYDDRFEITADVGQELVEFFHNEPLTVGVEIMLDVQNSMIKHLE